MQISSRSCSNPKPANKGRDCKGPSRRTGSCNGFSCPGKFWRSKIGCWSNIPQLKLKLAVANHVTEELSAEIVTVPTRHQHMAGEVAGDWGRVHRLKTVMHIHAQVIFNFFIYFGNDATTSWGGITCHRYYYVVPLLFIYIPVHGGYTPWSRWRSCTRSCGQGMQISTRQIYLASTENLSYSKLSPLIIVIEWWYFFQFLGALLEEPFQP